MLTMKIRASSLSDLFDCAKRWEARYILNMRTPTSGAAHLGTSIHAGTALFDKQNLLKSPVSIDDATGKAVDTLYSKDSEVNWEADDITPQKVEPIAKKLVQKYCETIAPQHEYIAVESRCDDLAIQIDDVTLTLSGIVDRVRKTEQGFGISDIKTGKSAVTTSGYVAVSKHQIQLGVYEILAQQSIGVPLNAPAEVIGLQTNGSVRIATGLVDRPRLLLIGDEYNNGLLKMAAHILRSGLFPPNNRSMLCHEKYCPAYRVCAYK